MKESNDQSTDLQCGGGKIAQKDHMTNVLPIKHPLTGKRQLMSRSYLWELYIFMSVYFIRPLPETEKGHILWVEKFPQESQTQKLDTEKPCCIILGQFPDPSPPLHQVVSSIA